MTEEEITLKYIEEGWKENLRNSMLSDWTLNWLKAFAKIKKCKLFVTTFPSLMLHNLKAIENFLCVIKANDLILVVKQKRLVS